MDIGQSVLVPHFYKQGRIKEEDYKKWLMDETGKFIPKLIEMGNWTIEDIESTGFKLLTNEKSWCHFRGHGFDLFINLNPPPPARGNLFCFHSYKNSYKGNFRINLYTLEELKFVIRRTER